MMKKLCVLLIVCLLTGFASKATVISFIPSDFPEAWSEYQGSYRLNRGGIEQFCSSGRVTNEHFRIYKNQLIQFTSSIGMITRIEFVCVGYGQEQHGPYGFWGQTGYYYSGHIGVWTGFSSTVSLYAEYAQVRATRINVYVEENPIVRIDKNNLELNIGDSILLHATVEPSEILVPVEWSSSNNEVASVSSEGWVLAKKAGEAYITAGFENISATCHVKVLPNTSSIVLNANKLQMCVDDSFVLTATVLPPNDTDDLIGWAIADNSIIEGIPNDRSLIINAKNIGTTTVTAYANDGSGVCETCEVTVKSRSSTAAILSVGPCHLELQPGDTARIKAEAIPARPLLWTSDNENVAYVEDGLVTAKKQGIARITVSTQDFFNQSLDCWVTVINPNEEHLTGDVDNDGIIGVSDVVALIDMILSNDVGNIQYSDVNGDGGVNIADVVAVIDYLLNP